MGHIRRGLIFDRVKEQDFDVRELMRQRLPAVYGMDFGFTDPTAFVGALVDTKAMRLYIFTEWSGTGVTNAEICAGIKDLGIIHERIYCDSAGA